MNFSRRGFFKTGGLLAGAIYVAPSIALDFFTRPDYFFDPTKSYAGYVLIDRYLSPVVPQCVRRDAELLKQQMKQSVPIKYRNKVKWRAVTPSDNDDPFNAWDALVWRYDP